MMDQKTPRIRRPRPLFAALLLVVCAVTVGAQPAGPGASSLSLVDLNFSGASIHQSGPTSFYVRNVGVDGDGYAFLVERSGSATWSVTGIIPEGANLLPPETILDFATISAPDDSTIRIDGVLVGSTVYGGSLVVGDDAELELAGQLRLAPSGSINEARSGALREIFAARTQADLDALVAEGRADLEETVARIEAERDALRVERDRLESELAGVSGAAVGAGSDSDAASPLTGHQVASLLKERDQLAGDIVGLVMENNELRDERKSLSEQIAELQGRNSELKGDIDVMTAEVDRLEELVAAYRGAPGSGTAEWGFPGDYVRSADLHAATQAVTGELRSLDRRVAALELAATGLADLEAAVRTGDRTAGEAAPTATEDQARAAADRAEQAARLARVQAELADLVVENEALRAEKQDLEERVLNEILSNGFVRMMRDRLTRRLATGFATGVPDTGSWTVRHDSAIQADSASFFAKLAMPVAQAVEPVLYSFRVRSLDDGWVGLGLHLFVEDVTRRAGYGMGSSLLVWLTRDPAARRSTTTYLQLYRSDDDVNMARVLDAAIPEAVDGFLNVDVLYEPTSQYITIAVNGTDRVRYRTWFGIDSGVEIALRSLGRAEFRDFAVRTMPAVSRTP